MKAFRSNFFAILESRDLSKPIFKSILDTYAISLTVIAFSSMVSDYRRLSFFIGFPTTRNQRTTLIVKEVLEETLSIVS